MFCHQHFAEFSSIFSFIYVLNSDNRSAFVTSSVLVIVSKSFEEAIFFEESSSDIILLHINIKLHTKMVAALVDKNPRARTVLNTHDESKPVNCN